MPATPLDEFRRVLERLDYTRSRMEALHSEGRITLTDLHSVYEALFLRAVTGFEVFIESLFVSILDGSAKYPKRRVAVRMTVSSNRALKDILLQGRDYLDWIPISRTIERAGIYLNGGRPFSEITDGDRSAIKTITLIRHAIAHQGAHAKKVFRDKVIGSRALLPVEKRPAGFLRSQANPNQRRFEVYIIQLGRIALELS